MDHWSADWCEEADELIEVIRPAQVDILKKSSISSTIIQWRQGRSCSSSVRSQRQARSCSDVLGITGLLNVLIHSIHDVAGLRVISTDKEIALSLSVDNPIKQPLQWHRVCY